MGGSGIRSREGEVRPIGGEGGEAGWVVVYRSSLEGNRQGMTWGSFPFKS